MIRRVLLSITLLLTLGLTLSASAQVKTLPFNPKAIPQGLKVKGEIEHGLRWVDRAGEHYLLFSSVTKTKKTDHSEITSSYLYATHYRLKNKQVKLVRTLRDRNENCEFEKITRFNHKSSSITDLDQNGLAETTFVYYLGCSNDVSPIDAKLALLENGKKYMIRGETTLIYPGGMKEGGSYKVDPSLLKAPNVFLEHALKVWKAHTVWNH